MILRPCGFPSNSLKSVTNVSSNLLFLFSSRFSGIYSNIFFAHYLIAASPK